MTLEAARKFLPRLDSPNSDGEGYTYGTTLSAYLIGWQIQPQDVVWSKSAHENVIYAYHTGVGVGYLMAMQHAGKVPMWVLRLAIEDCLLDMEHDQQKRFVVEMKELIFQAGISFEEIVIFARALPHYLTGYDADDIMVLMNREGNDIQDHWKNSRITDIELM